MHPKSRKFQNYADPFDDVIQANMRLNSNVIELINASQELGMKQEFQDESNEYQLQCCLNLRISEIWSWRWILEDLSKRLEEVAGVLDHELHAVRVVLERLTEEIFWRSQDLKRPGTLKPIDGVEQTLLKEFKMLKNQKLYFETIKTEIEDKILRTKCVTHKLLEDLKRKDITIEVEKSCMQAQFNHEKVTQRKRSTPLSRWQKRCESLKREGLEALNSAFCTRDQVRLARVNLSILAQTEAALVDAALRRRLHRNQRKLDELRWQEKESKQDLKILSEEKLLNEKNVNDMIARIQLVEARLSERQLRAPGEVIKDEVDRRLRKEIATLKRGVKEFGTVISNITKLEESIKNCLAQINCCISDLTTFVDLDRNRIKSREMGEDRSKSGPKAPEDNAFNCNYVNLDVITEEDETNDYPT